MCWSGFKYSWCWGLLTVYRCAVVLRLKSSTTVLLQPFNRMSNRPGGLNTLQAGWAFMTRGNRKGFCLSQRGSHSFKYFGAIHTQRQEEWLMCFLVTTTAARQQYSGKINTAFIDGSTRSKSVMSFVNQPALTNDVTLTSLEHSIIAALLTSWPNIKDFFCHSQWIANQMKSLWFLWSQFQSQLLSQSCGQVVRRSGYLG